jgi:hypothetical protein
LRRLAKSIGSWLWVKSVKSVFYFSLNIQNHFACASRDNQVQSYLEIKKRQLLDSFTFQRHTRYLCLNKIIKLIPLYTTVL